MSRPKIDARTVQSLSTQVDWKKIVKTHPDEVLLDVVYGDADRGDEMSVSKRLHQIFTRDAMTPEERSRIRANGHWRSIDPMTEILLRRQNLSISGLAAISALAGELRSNNRHVSPMLIIEAADGKCRVNAEILSQGHNVEKGCITGEIDVIAPLVLPDGRTLTWCRTLIHGLAYDEDLAYELAGAPLSRLIGEDARFAGDPRIALVTGDITSGMQVHLSHLPALLSVMDVEILNENDLAASSQPLTKNGWLDMRHGIRKVIASASGEGA